MVDLENFKDDVDPREKAEEQAERVSTLVDRMDSYLFGSFDCPECGLRCEADTTWDSNLMEEVRSWRCDSCNSHWYRENIHGDDRLPQPKER